MTPAALRDAVDGPLPGRWRLLVVSLLVTALPVLALGAALGVGLRDQGVEQGREQARAQADVITQMVVLPALTGDSLELGIDGRVHERMQIAADLARHQGVITRLRLRAFSGYTAYSDDDSASRLPRAAPAFQAALGGRTDVAVVRDPSAGRGRTVRVLRPLLANATGNATGVLEVYLPYEPIAAGVERSIRSQYARLAVGLLALCAALVLLSFQTTKRLRQLAALREHEARHDSLTGLPNRAAFHDRLAALGGQERPALIGLLDLDGFKAVNDRHGHREGDRLLQAIAAHLQAAIPADGVAARLGGDEFALLLPGVEGEDVARELLESLQHGLVEAVGRRWRDVEVGASVGGALHPGGGGDLDGVLHRADLAMYRAKSGASAVALYSPLLAEDARDAGERVRDRRGTAGEARALPVTLRTGTCGAPVA